MHARTLHSVLLGALASSTAACGGSSSGSSGVDPGIPLTRPFDCNSAQATYDALRAATGVYYLEVRDS